MFFKDGVHFPFEFGLLQDQFSQWSKTFLTRDTGAGFALGAIRQIEIFYLLQRRGCKDGSCKFGRQLALHIDQPSHISLAFMQCAQRTRTISNGLNLHFVQAASHLLAIASNERDGISFI